jgi:hypothetical protein
VSVLDRKLLRDLWALRGQVLTIALLIGAGVAVLVMSVSSFLSLRGAQQEFWSSCSSTASSAATPSSRSPIRAPPAPCARWRACPACSRPRGSASCRCGCGLRSAAACWP